VDFVIYPNYDFNVNECCYIIHVSILCAENMGYINRSGIIKNTFVEAFDIV
jgi:hypothetical protein